MDPFLAIMLWLAAQKTQSAFSEQITGTNYLIQPSSPPSVCSRWGGAQKKNGRCEMQFYFTGIPDDVNCERSDGHNTFVCSWPAPSESK